MKKTKIIFISLIIVISLTFISSISAQDIDNLNLTDDNNDIIEINDDSKLNADESNCCEDDSQPKTWTVQPDAENPNQVQKPTVQPVIDNANPGDTIILNGTFVHCHFMINKTLNILATPGTSVGVCPHHTHMMKYGTGPEENGIFYISPEANGTVLSGFSFTNDFYYIANNVYNPFGVYVDADNVELNNLTFDWVGVSQKSSKYDPGDFLFNAIILNATQNTTIQNIALGNVNSFVKSLNASNLSIDNISNVKLQIKEKTDSKIIVSNLNIFVVDNGNLQAILRDINDNVLSQKQLNILIDGIGQSITTNEKGIVNLPVKYVSAGVHYVTFAFMGDDDYKPTIQSCKISVSKKSAILTAPKATLKVKKTKKILITLKSNSKAISGKKLTIKVNGKTFSAKTNSKGIAKIKVRVAKKGTFKYTVRFAGDNTYNAMSKIGKIIVKK